MRGQLPAQWQKMRLNSLSGINNRSRVHPSIISAEMSIMVKAIAIVEADRQ
jgi:hypothetical protein